jgi:hypothetical protein
MLRDKQTGKVASAKNRRKWGKLFGCRSMFIDQPHDVNDIPQVRITFPNGSNIFSRMMTSILVYQRFWIEK